MKRQIKNDYIPFEFKYEQYSNQKMTLREKIVLTLLTVSLIIGSVKLSGEILNFIADVKKLSKTEQVKEYKSPVSIVLDKNPMYYSEDLKTKYNQNFNKLIEKYGSNDKEFIKQLELLTGELVYIKIDKQSYEKFNNFLKTKPYLYKESINILKEKNYSLMALLLTLESEKHKNYTHNEKEHLPLIDKAINSDIDNELFVELAKNYNLPVKLKNSIGKKMLEKLNERVLFLDKKLQDIYDKELNERIKNNVGDTNYFISEEAFKKQKRGTLVSMNSKAIHNIVSIYPDTKKYYMKNRDLFKGLNKLE